MTINNIFCYVLLVFGGSSQDVYVYLGCIVLIALLLLTRFTYKKLRVYIRWRAIHKIHKHRMAALDKHIRDYTIVTPA